MTADEVRNQYADQDDNGPLVEAIGDEDTRHRDALVRDVEPTVDRTGVEPYPRQRREGRVDEDHLHQQWDVPQHLDPAGGNAADYPVVGQAGQADDHSEDAGEEDPRDGQAQGVDHGSPEGPATRVRVGVDSLAYLDVYGALEEVELGVDVPGPKVVPGLTCQEPHGAEHHDQEDDLGHPLEDDDVAPKRYPL